MRADAFDMLSQVQQIPVCCVCGYCHIHIHTHKHIALISKVIA